MSRLEKRLLGAMGRVNRDFQLLEPGDVVAVALSGGKDSFALMALLQVFVRRSPFPVKLIGLNLDQGFTKRNQEGIAAWGSARGVTVRLEQRDHTRILLDKLPKGATPCPLCARLRRGVLYDLAVEMGATKLALGHHRDDLAETLLLNLFYAGQMKSMAVRHLSDDGRMTVIRPLAYAMESEIADYALEQGFPQLPKPTCGYGEQRYRSRMKGLLAQLNADNPKVTANIMASMANIRPSHLLDPHYREIARDGEDRLDGE